MKFILTIHQNASIPVLFVGCVVMAIGAIALPSLLQFLAAIAFPVLATYAIFLCALAVFRFIELRLGA